MNRKHALIVGMVIFACFCMGYVDAVLQPGYAVKSAIKILLFLGLPLLYARIDRGFCPKELFRLRRQRMLSAVLAGVGVYAIIIGAYFLLRNFFDFSILTGALTTQTGVSGSNFIWVSIYISFANSFLEEFFFRGFSFLVLKRTLEEGKPGGVTDSKEVKAHKASGDSKENKNSQDIGKPKEIKYPKAAKSPKSMLSPRSPFSPRTVAYAFSAFAFAAYHVAMMLGWFAPPVTVLALAGLFCGGLIFNRFDEAEGSILLSWLVHMFANFAINTVGFMLFAAG